VTTERSKRPPGGGSRICIVTPSHLSANPRVVKEADALHDAGFDVHVVFAQSTAGHRSIHDDELLASRHWSWTKVQSARRAGNALQWTATAIRQRFLATVPAWLWPFTTIAERVECRAFAQLLRATQMQVADLYIGHYPAGLSVAALSARLYDAQVGFDAEDFHTGDTTDRDEIARIDFLQRRYVGGCTYLTAASRGIADALADNYDIAKATVIHNTFPWTERDALDGKYKDRRGDELSLYWYSQTIGLDRGIQDVIKAAALLGGPVQIHLRGSVDENVSQALISLAHGLGVAERLYFHPQVSPNELLSRASEHDVGLALEQGHTMNRAICVTNKLFHYLLAGLPVVATSTPGQVSILQRSSPLAGKLYVPGDIPQLAKHLEQWREHPDALRAAKAAALSAARLQWNWEIERENIVDLVTKTLAADERSSESAGVREATLAERSR
jgi:glycosyltransferase involved in cell wall biosynthesis